MNPFSGINTWLTDTLGPMGPLLAVGLLGMLLILIALPTVMKKQRDRFRELKDSQPNQPVAEKKRALRRAGQDRQAGTLCQVPGTAKERRAYGFKAADACKPAIRPRTRFACTMRRSLCWRLPFLWSGCCIAVLRSISGEVTTNTMLMLTLLPCAVGYYLPKYWVDQAPSTASG
jgi:tight adherence protein C